METRLETPTRKRWREIIAPYADSGGAEYRRNDQRAIVEFGAVRLSFVGPNGARVVHTGRLLNASDAGMMVRQNQSIPARTRLQIEVEIDQVKLALSGSVVHVTDTVGGYKIGVELLFAD